MKKLIVIVTAFVSVNAGSLEYKSQLRCKGNNCVKETKIKGLKEVELKLSDLAADQCLLDLKTEKISRLELVDQRSKKIFSITEIEDFVLLRELVFFDTKLFDRSQKIIPCSEVAGILGDEVQLQKCIKSNGTSVKKLFCEKERLRNF